MGDSIVGSKEQFEMLFDFEKLKGGYESFTKLIEQCQLGYSHVQDELMIDHQAKAFEFLYNLVSFAHKDIVSQITNMQEHYSELDGYAESIDPVLTQMLDDLDSKLEDMAPAMDSLLDTKMQGNNWKGFSGAIQKFLYKFGLW